MKFETFEPMQGLEHNTLAVALNHLNEANQISEAWYREVNQTPDDGKYKIMLDADGKSGHIVSIFGTPHGTACTIIRTFNNLTQAVDQAKEQLNRVEDAVRYARATHQQEEECTPSQ